jgi:linoleoyl-CoA desaturase
MVTVIEPQRLREFTRAIDALRARLEAELGEPDVAHLRRVRRWSRALEVVGRGLLQLSVDPMSFLAGVGALFLHLQLETIEIGHTVLHGVYERRPGAEPFQSRAFVWRTPVDEQCWRSSHNLRHHGHTNVVGEDPDIHFGIIRLNERTPHRSFHWLQVPLALLSASHFTAGMSLQMAGVVDAVIGSGRPGDLDYLRDRSLSSLAAALWNATRKMAPYYAREYLLFPALAGPFFLKVAAGNWLAATLRDYYTAATIYCGHVGDEVRDYSDDEHARRRGEWYVMQIEATNNFRVGPLLSLLCGGLDRHIEHHLFPRVPPNRLREVSKDVQELCSQYGVEYRDLPWRWTLGGVLRRLWRLSAPAGSCGVEASGAAA